MTDAAQNAGRSWAELKRVAQKQISFNSSMLDWNEDKELLTNCMVKAADPSFFYAKDKNNTSLIIPLQCLKENSNCSDKGNVKVCLSRFHVLTFVLFQSPPNVHNAPKKSVRLKTEYIDVDLIRGKYFG